jgi:hypothetical protein
MLPAISIRGNDRMARTVRLAVAGNGKAQPDARLACLL